MHYIAFEFNGKQHYYLSHWTDVWVYSPEKALERYTKTNLNDLARLSQCKEEGVALIVVSCFDEPSSWYDIIIKQYELWTGKEAPKKHSLDFKNVLRLVSKTKIEDLT